MGDGVKGGEEIIQIRAELHVHTVLSPCAEVEMIPPLIVREAVSRGIGLIAITDHNASANVRAVQKAADGTSLTVLPGMELQTREEVHLLCLFDADYDIGAFQAWVDERMPDLQNRPEYFGEQFIVDETGDFLGREPRMLLTSASVSLDEAILTVNALGGLAIPAHVDRNTFGLIQNLGFLPENAPVEAVEISRRIHEAEARRKYPQLGKVPLVKDGDAHRLDELLGANEVTVTEPSLSELRLALAGARGRTLRIVDLDY